MTPEQRDTFFDLYHERVAEPHPAVFAKFAQDNVDVTEGPRVVTEILTAVAIVQANAVSMGGESEHGCGVFASYSRMNHSCTPNVHNSYNPTVRKLTIHATHQINKGEEITATCINFNRAHEQRTADLSNWDIICTCKSCAGPTAAASDKRRLRMFEADQKIAAYRQGMQHNLGLSIPRNAHEALEVAEEMLVVIREEGITGFSLTGVWVFPKYSGVCWKCTNNIIAIASVPYPASRATLLPKPSNTPKRSSRSSVTAS